MPTRVRHRPRCAALVAAALVGAPVLATLAPQTARALENAGLNGAVKDKQTGEPLAGVLVIAQCNCLQGPRETQTNADGIYAFRDLPPGIYTVQVLYRENDLNRIVELVPGAKVRIDFQLAPDQRWVETIVVDAAPIRTDGANVTKVDVERMRKIPLGGTNRDYTAVVDIAPTAGRDAGGIRIGSATSAESKYVVDSQNTTSPAFGTVGASIVQEFVDEVEVVEGVFDAENGGASGGLVRARRIGGTNKWRGQALFRFTPRIAPPRFIDATDESLRVAEIYNYEMQGVVTLAGPIVRDKLFFAVGVAPSGSNNSLVQSFYRRRDKDLSGGYETCPYANGVNDCAANGNYIDTVKFAEQKFRTGRFDLGWTASLDWQISPRHRLRLSGGGGPNFRRRSFRQPPGTEPNAFGTNPNATLGGASRVASGVVNDSFGVDYGNGTGVGLEYEGRALNDKLELDGYLYYTRLRSQQAWKLDHEGMRQIPLTQERDTQGRNLYDLLDRDDATRLVQGVGEACNDSNLPGLTCPTRVWLSGGIGSYSGTQQDRIGGGFALTHFFSGKRAGAHQFKYGLEIDGSQIRQRSAYSGGNDPDFYANCPKGQVGGGEYCFDPASGEYTINTANRVNNNRVIVVQSDNPDQRQTLGFGRVRYEQDDLRAIATPLGAGVRVPAYASSLSSQNYAFFVQDKWSILSNLYVSGGVRWEIQELRDIFGRRGLLIADNVAPRASLVYDWTDEGKSRLYVSYGWFYAQVPAILGNRIFGGLVNVNRTYRHSDCEAPVTIGGVTHDRLDGAAPTEWCTDGGQNTSGLTFGAVVPDLKGMYVQRFNAGYEHEVIEDLLVGVRWQHDGLGRAIEDVSTNGGLNFLLANPGESVSRADIARQEERCTELQAAVDATDADDPQRQNAIRELNRCDFLASSFRQVGGLFSRPIRNYDAWVFQITKRFAKNWVFQGSYIYSRLIGNYDGFVDRNTGAINIGASTTYDIPELVRNSYGPLWDNRPHQLKLDGYYTFDLRRGGRLTLGVNFRYQSGSPISVYADNNRYAGQSLVYMLPRGAGGRLEPNYFANLGISYAYPLPGELELEVVARLVNLTNSKAVLRVDETYSFSQSRAIAGGDLDDLKHAKVQTANAPTAYFQRTVVPAQGNFGVQTQFQQPIGAQFEVRLRF
ncbi:Carboxypeptidase regulatory-like domain-containing protein [Nannocystis exedens]|uniref:Carboxypeptidase regulatory-like domain-containing protein n=1 Tax=Nannocystis exedens TaxID=54 RepID=A0A1I1TGZ2_9BACT|nr:TonB-dependent receptor [Nannocystis exedens]PCC66569.1 TonB-dependent receptor [Nannocystis exedens]SFD57856.1 Carboxypeptidase regulatory-like domain-containing protein [Nannocystis exedens]